MREQNWDWENRETIGRGLPNQDFQPVMEDPAIYDDPLYDPLLDDY